MVGWVGGRLCGWVDEGVRGQTSVCAEGWLEARWVTHLLICGNRCCLLLLLLQGGCEDPHYRMVGAAADLFNTMHGEDT